MISTYQFQLLLLALLYIHACRNGVGANDQDTSLISADANWAEGSKFEEKLLTYEDENRDIWQQPELVIDLLGPLEDKTVVDLGAGSGYFTFRLLPKAKKVIAVEIDTQFIAFLEDKRNLLPNSQQSKFDTRLAEPDDPMLQDSEADAILLVSTYVYIENRVDYFRQLKSKLSPGGKIVIIEFKKKHIPNGPPSDEKIALSEVENELKTAGYSSIQTDDQTLSYQYIVTARI